ncbi:MAG: hypothetical protein ACI9H9_003380 [Pseudoalteromonas tetraodonis]|jgi:hypothetical protein|uniref:DUF1488 domain-containing protein n=5 Tax=Pseudoalteromonas TaxID=53246 RepID=A0A9W4QXH6_PSEHA|nr:MULTISPECIES: DUF1488 domain-containing protein [Pseudoalteromonas]ADT66999.1 hypothetical protein PSM_A0038 [Pseudoalteromonas sp. SM9913]ALQ53376.1 hypothetical protein PI2015_0034 [Pseudoalteromonas issachenkonii]ATC89117.1 hypothetical protein PISS_a0036 [Pseudoalteromonas issachenkonii]ATD01643.1 hypothetical protein PTET_a0038 [Pseudoalteromonas tetraodonis]EWS98703.1 membrane protein [Pseudoalteromonas sp. SCSIO_11900]|tara:strand:+ start:696 stop:950 length:255 start_codon:yes stop_codon:yes gene_type:complete
MNQAIQFIDRLEFREPTHQLVFFAQVSGMLVECVIAVSSLNLADESHATRYFEQYRFDYEERAEQLIEDESYNSAGQIEVSLLN